MNQGNRQSERITGVTRMYRIAFLFEDGTWCHTQVFPTIEMAIAFAKEFIQPIDTVTGWNSESYLDGEWV